MNIDRLWAKAARTLPASAAFPSFKMVVIKNKLLGPGS
jgi:hypothetical protein